MIANSKPTLIILAAGMGSRYGGLKQMDSFTPEGDTIIDFSLYDAIQAGFGKVVFVIRKKLEQDFKALFSEKVKGKLEVTYVFQEIENIPENFDASKREKPWGTGHALLMAKDKITTNFAIINADDFYGRNAFEKMVTYLNKTDKSSYNFSMVSYLLKNTLSENGYVSRGECTLTETGFLKSVVERTKIKRINGEVKTENEKGEVVLIDENTNVSMNFWGFTPKCFQFLEDLFLDFLKSNILEPKTEFYLPLAVNQMLKFNEVSVKVLQSNASWFGVTYKDDKPLVKKEILKLKEAGVYPKKLWE